MFICCGSGGLLELVFLPLDSLSLSMIGINKNTKIGEYNEKTLYTASGAVSCFYYGKL